MRGDERARESALWEAYRGNDRPTLEAMIHPGALDVGPAGPRDLSAVFAALDRMEIRAFSFEDFRVAAFGDVEVATYTAIVDGLYAGAPFADSRVVASTVWMHDGDSWRVIHRHESHASATITRSEL
jgi:ketosteroid isomerase-like protein